LWFCAAVVKLKLPVMTRCPSMIIISLWANGHLGIPIRPVVRRPGWIVEYLEL